MLYIVDVVCFERCLNQEIDGNTAVKIVGESVYEVYPMLQRDDLERIMLHIVIIKVLLLFDIYKCFSHIYYYIAEYVVSSIFFFWLFCVCV